MRPNVNSIGIVIVNFHNPNETLACVKSLENVEKKHLRTTFYIVDNGGTAISSKSLSKKLPQAQIINSRNNVGYSKGCNLGIKAAIKNGAGYILLINPDTTVNSKRFLSELIGMGSDLTSPLIQYRQNNRLVYDFGGKIDYLFGRNTHLRSGKKTVHLGIPDYFSGACILIKNSVFKKIGYLDENYFLYYEDADFCLRAIEAGFTQKLCRKVVIFHRLSTTTNKLGHEKIRILANSHLRFCRKHLSWIFAPFYIFFNLFLRAKTL